MRIAAGNNNSIIGSIVRIVIRTEGRIIIIEIIIKPTSAEHEKKYECLLISSREADLEGVSRREGVKVSAMVFGIDGGSVAGLFFDVETVQ